MWTAGFVMKVPLKSRNSSTLTGLLILVFFVSCLFYFTSNKLRKYCLRIFSFLSLPTSASLYKLYFFKIMKSPDFKNCSLWLFTYPELHVYPVSFDLEKKIFHSTKLLIIIMVYLTAGENMLNSASMILDFHIRPRFRSGLRFQSGSSGITERN